ncbi:MAG TPA: hypothetical protein VMY39_04685 [Planctomycetota bacterium]|nr:hypothetical protein [Planctomycetota bacterium]
MKSFILSITLATLVSASPAAWAGGRLKTAVMPVEMPPTMPRLEFAPGEHVLKEMVIGLGKVERFDVMISGDTDRLLEEHLIKPDEVKLENAAKIARALGVRLLLFPKIDTLTVETRTEDRVLIQTKTVVCTAGLGGTLYDAETNAAHAIGPYTAEDRKVGGRDMHGRTTLTAETVEKMLKEVLDETAKKVRSRVYVLYPLVGTITAGDGKSVTLDIGTAMGVAVKQKYTVTAMVDRENPVTGLVEKVAEEVSVLEVVSVKELSATCRVVSGDETPLVGSTVERKLR